VVSGDADREQKYQLNIKTINKNNIKIKNYHYQKNELRN
jgi:hypothetical protein